MFPTTRESSNNSSATRTCSFFCPVARNAATTAEVVIWRGAPVSHRSEGGGGGGAAVMEPTAWPTDLQTAHPAALSRCLRSLNMTLGLCSCFVTIIFVDDEETGWRWTPLLFYLSYRTSPSSLRSLRALQLSAHTHTQKQKEINKLHEAERVRVILDTNPLTSAKIYKHTTSGRQTETLRHETSAGILSSPDSAALRLHYSSHLPALTSLLAPALRRGPCCCRNLTQFI